MAEEQAPQTVLFAKLGDKGFIAGISLDLILRDAPLFYPELPREAVVLVQEQEIPETYKWSVRMVKEFDSWHPTGTYFLAEHFETYGAAFREYFPNVKI